jgi:hypothetical protein
MAFDPISAALNIGTEIIDRLWPDPEKANDAKLALLKMQQSGELAQLAATTDLAKAQIMVNQAAAASTDRLQHWRGAAGWVCVLAYGYTYLLAPIGTWLLAMAGHPVVAPEINTADLSALLMGMLGLGGMHVYQTVKAKKE